MSKDNIKQSEIHQKFLAALGDMVVSHSSVDQKPLEVDLKLPLPRRIRLYVYRATDPPGGRTIGENKIQLIVPGQIRHQRGSFDYSGERFVVLAGYKPEYDIFILWDADFYVDFSYSRNVQVKAETIYDAIVKDLAFQKRRIRGHGEETVIVSRATNLKNALLYRMKISLSTYSENTMYG